MKKNRLRIEKFDKEIPIKILQALSQSIQVPFLDMAPTMLREGGQKLYLPIDMHLNRKGNEVVAKSISKWFQENFKNEPQKADDGS